MVGSEAGAGSHVWQCCCCWEDLFLGEVGWQVSGTADASLSYRASPMFRA